MNDIEAAARLALDALVELEWSDLFREYDSDPLPEIACPDCGAFQNPAGSHHGNCRIYPAISALRSALAHAARGEGERCPTCGSFKRDNACRDAWHDTPPPATGEAGTRGEVEKAREAFFGAAAKWVGMDQAAKTRPFPTYSQLEWSKAWNAMHDAYRALPEAREGGRG